MPASAARIREMAGVVQQIASQQKLLVKQLEELLETQQTLNIDWANLQPEPNPSDNPDQPVLSAVDENGYINGQQFAPNDVLLAINAFQSISDLLRGKGTTAANYLGSLNAVADVST